MFVVKHFARKKADDDMFKYRMVCTFWYYVIIINLILH